MTTLTTKEIEWTLPKASTTEGPTFYVFADSGISMMTQMVYSSMNSWSPTVQLVARIFGPNGIKKSVTLTKGSGDLKVSQDKLSATCGPMSVQFLPGEKWGYQVSLKDGGVEFEFTSKLLTEGFQVNGGRHLFQDESEDKGWVQSRFLPKQSATGFIKIDGTSFDLKGSVMSTFVQQFLPQNVALWNFCNFQSEKDAVMLYQVSLID
jgi:hypothetical protein